MKTLDEITAEVDLCKTDAISWTEWLISSRRAKLMQEAAIDAVIEHHESYIMTLSALNDFKPSGAPN